MEMYSLDLDIHIYDGMPNDTPESTINAGKCCAHRSCQKQPIRHPFWSGTCFGFSLDVLPMESVTSNVEIPKGVVEKPFRLDVS